MTDSLRRGIDDAQRWTEVCNAIKIARDTSGDQMEFVFRSQQLRMKHIELQRLGEIASVLEVICERLHDEQAARRSS